jgi:hypothetical protein
VERLSRLDRSKETIAMVLRVKIIEMVESEKQVQLVERV